MVCDVTPGAALNKASHVLVASALVALAIPAIWYVMSPAARGTASSDLVGYWSAARIFLDGSNPYDAATVLDLQKQVGRDDPLPLIMWSPPWLFACIFPLALMPLWLARLAWFLSQLLLLILSADWFWRASGGASSGRAAAWVLSVGFVPAVIALNIGQTSVMVLAGMCLFLAALRREKDFLAGAATFLIALKPQVLFLFWIVFLFWIFRDRRWKLLAGAFFGLVVPTLFSFLLNPPIYGYYLQALDSEYGPLRWKTATLGTLLRIMSPSAGGWIQFLPAVAGVFLATLLWWRQRRGFDWEACLIPIALLSTVTAAYCWTFDWVVLLPAAISIFVAFERAPRRHFACLAVLVLAEGLVVLTIRNVARYPATFWFPTGIAIIYLVCVGLGRTDDRLAGSSPETQHP
jgi:hypothetical protein